MAKIKRLLMAALMLPVLAACGQASPDIELNPVNIEDNGSNDGQQEVTEAPDSSTPEKPVNGSADVMKILNGMTLKEKVCQMIICMPEDITDYVGYDVFTYMDDQFRGCYAEYPVGGLIYFGDNIVYSDQVKALTRDTQELAQNTVVGIFQATDEEGGSITRVSRNLGIHQTNDMSWYGSNNDSGETYDVGAAIGGYLAEYGFNVDFAPVADVDLNPDNELGSRIFSSDPTVVSDMTSAFIKGLHSKKICSTLKHFPGLGAGGGNTHYDSVYIERSYDQLSLTEFPAFKGGIDSGTDFVMVGHQILSSAAEKDGKELPSDLSPTVITDWLKGDLGFKGLVITDSHRMAAVTNYYSGSEAALLSIEAGCDIILMPNDLRETVSGLVKAVESGKLSEDRINESVIKILTKKSEMGIL